MRVYASVMAKTSAGLVMYRIRSHQLEVLLVHPGGPFWANKDAGAWFVPKGEVRPGEDEFVAARREFQEETGLEPGAGFVELGMVKHRSGKIVRAWAFEGDCDPADLRSNTFTMEWPPRSGNMREFPEIDRAQFFLIGQAREKIYPMEFELIGRLAKVCAEKGLIKEEPTVECAPPTTPIQGKLFGLMSQPDVKLHSRLTGTKMKR